MVLETVVIICETVAMGFGTVVMSTNLASNTLKINA